MEIFVFDHEIAQLDATRSSARDSSQLVNLVTLCWHWRQRDTSRALALAEEADALLSLLPPARAEARRLSARLLLVRAEAKFLYMERDVAEALAQLALRAFSSLDDALGCADVHRLLAFIADDRGNFSGRDAALEVSREFALRAGAPLRAELAEIGGAYFAICRDPRSARNWHDRIEAMIENGHPAVIAWAAAIQGTCAIMSRDFGRAIECGILAHDNALRTGQIRFAIKAAIKIGFAFTKLNDYQTGLDWMRRALALARPTRWPECIGLCLSHTVKTLRQLGQAAAAQELIDEALGAAVPTSDPYSYSCILMHHGQLALERGDYRAALTTFLRLEQRADHLSQTHFQIESSRGQAYAFSSMARSMEARAAALTALALAQMQRDSRREVAALQLLAEIHSRHVLPAPDGMNAASTPLFFLGKALSLAASIEGFSIPRELFDAAAHEYAEVGDFARAYQMSLRGIAARDASLQQAMKAHPSALDAHSQTVSAMMVEAGNLRQQPAPVETPGSGKNELHDTKRRLFRKRRHQEDNPDGLMHFLAGANHRLRQPIHAMNLYLGAMEVYELPPKARPLLENVRRCAQALGESFLSLLDLSRLQTNMVQPHCEPFPVISLLSRIRSEYAAQARDKGLDFCVVPSSAWVESDPLLVEQILRNLAANALRFTHCGKILIGCRRKGHMLRIEVYDTGIGMTQDRQHAVFEEFFRFGNSEAVAHGLGLGLAIVRRLAHLLSIPIALKSEQGRGSMFAIDLPLLTRPAPSPIAAAENAVVSDVLVDKLVVVVDDDCGILDAMRALLERWHCAVVTASSGAEAIAKLGASVRSPDALVCDFRLHASETGLDIIQALRIEFNQEIPALLVTGEAVTDQIQMLLPQGVPLLQKPVQPDKLNHMLVQLFSLQKDLAL